MFSSVGQRLRSRSATLLLTLENRLDRILQAWLVLAGLACFARVAFSPAPAGGTGLVSITPYLLLIIAPFASTLLALHWFADGDRLAQPRTRLARIGAWRPVSLGIAQSHKLYGAGGIMVSLVIGMMLNVPVRAMEFLAAMPPLPAGTPEWLSTLRIAMTFDIVLFSSLYMIAAVAALRRVPLFPRLLAAIWACDLAMQLLTAELVAAHKLPAAVAGSLQTLLEGNVKKTLISVAIWLPYLLLSTRVNVTYRHRIPA